MTRSRVMLLALIIGCARPDATRVDDALVDLVVRTLPARVVLPRLSVPVGYARCADQGSRACALAIRPGTREFRDLTRVARTLRAADVDRSGHAVGLAELAWSATDPSAIDRAVNALVWARRHDPEDRALLNDAAAAFLARGIQRDNPIDFVRALELLGSVPDTAGPIAFNRALALEALGLADDAVSAWTGFIESGRDPGWADEARSRRAALRARAERNSVRWSDSLRNAFESGDVDAMQRFARLDPQAAREYALFDPGLKADESPGSISQKALGAIGAGLKDESVTRIAEGMASRAGFAAFRALGAARSAFARANYAEAATLYTHVATVLGNEHPELRWWSDVELGSTRYYQSRYAEAQSAFDRVLREADPDRLPALVGRAHWGRGVAAARLGRIEEAWREYEAAADLTARAGEAANAAFLNSMIAEMLDQLGRSSEAWPHRLGALAVLGAYPPNSRLHSALVATAGATARDGWPRVAVVLQTAGLRVARQLDLPWAVAEAEAQLVWLRSGIGTDAPDTSGFARARGASLEIRDSVARGLALALVRTAEARTLTRVDPLRATALLDSTIDFYRSRSQRISLAGVLLDRARTRRADRDLAGARTDLADAIRVVELQRSGFIGDARAATFADAWQSIFDEAVDFELRDGEGPRAALDRLEQGRRLHLKPETFAPPPGRLTAPDGVLLIQYAVVYGRVYRWIVGRSGLSFDALAVPADSLHLEVDRFIHDLQNGTGSDALATRLGRVLLPPIDTAVHRLVIVPDGILSDLPFQALKEPTRGGRVLEYVSTSTAPSFGFAFAMLHRRHELPDPLSAVLIGNSAGGRLDELTLPELPRVRDEIGSLAALYPVTRVLLDRDANRDNVLASLDLYPVLHFAGHALFDARHPEASTLLLHPDSAARPVRLYAGELEGRSFAILRVAILSACESAAPASGRSGSLWGLVLPLINGGVESVIGTLWQVDDRVSARLVTLVHKGIIAGLAPADALREAQLELLRTAAGNPAVSSTWPAFQSMGW